MTPDDKEVIQKARPYMVLIIAVLLRVRYKYMNAECFTEAQEFVKMWERTL